MRQTLEPTLIDRADADARDAAARAGVEIRILDDMEALTEASLLFAEVWRTGDESQLPAELMRALTHAGNYAAGAYAEGDLVGAIVGFLGRDDKTIYLHSHILGVSRSHRGANVGFETTLWAAADKMRGHMDASEYKHVALGLIFLGVGYVFMVMAGQIAVGG